LAKESIVATKPVENWSELFQQRVRWASKSTGYSSTYGKVLAIVVFSGNLAWIVSFLLWLIGLLDQNIFMLFVALKFSNRFYFDFSKPLISSNRNYNMC
jgi:cellulose synthase/poly-beta-1,6-N-acetylglucosamine synthase-like glycosyltransferase